MLTIAKNQEKLLKKILGVKDIASIHEKKLLKKAQRYSFIFSHIPGILCVCIGNSVAMNTAHQDSDIDLFIICKKKRIWTVRICLTFLLTLLWQRKTGKKHAGKFCLSFFITQDAMDLKKIAIKNDYYLAYWVKTLIPIVNKNQTFEKFQNINLYVKTSQDINRSPKTLTYIGNLIETLLKVTFLSRTKKSFQKLWKPFWVIITDDMLKFHDKDRRKSLQRAIDS